MSNTDSQGAAPKETTFRAFSREQGANYAEHRIDYHPRLYNSVLDFHASTGGQLDTVLDVGCGPGTAVRTLAPRFAHAVGIDPSEGMIATARSLGGVSSTSEPIRFEVATAEAAGSQLSPPIAEGSVDLLVAANAAHWFDMSAFWPQTARLLKPGGTVALWGSGSMLVDRSMPNGPAIQAAVDKFEKSLDDHMLPGNRLVRGLYADLPLPWTLADPVLEFDRASLVRKEWSTSEGSEPIDEFYTNQKPATVDALVKVLGTASPVVRWSKAHADAVGTESDPLQVMRKEVETLLREADMEPGAALIKGGVGGALLMVRKSVS